MDVFVRGEDKKNPQVLVFIGHIGDKTTISDDIDEWMRDSLIRTGVKKGTTVTKKERRELSKDLRKEIKEIGPVLHIPFSVFVTTEDNLRFKSRWHDLSTYF